MIRLTVALDKWAAKLARSLAARGFSGTVSLIKRTIHQGWILYLNEGLGADALSEMPTAVRLPYSSWISYLNDRFDKVLAADLQFAEQIHSNRWVLYLGRRFDRRFGVNTSGILYRHQLEPAHRFTQSTGYSATPKAIFCRMLRQLKLDFSRFTFVDIGCGKGKALLLAGEVPFKQIVGIDLSPEFMRIAEENFSRYRGMRRCSSVQFICMDAREFSAPDGPAIYYFFDPFGESVMKEIVQNIQRSLARAPWETYVVYYIANHQQALIESGFYPIQRTHLYAIYKATP